MMLIWLTQMHPCAPNYGERQRVTPIPNRHHHRRSKSHDPTEWTAEDLKRLDAWLLDDLDDPNDDADDPWETCSITGGQIRASAARKLEEKQWGYLRNG